MTEVDLQIADKIRRHLESSNNISLLQEFCQRTHQPLPIYQPANLGNVHTPLFGMSLIIAGQRFESLGTSTLKDAKKACIFDSYIGASKAIDHFENSLTPYFNNRERNYITLIFSLCSALNWPQPHIEVHGVLSFDATCDIDGQIFHSLHKHGRKTGAKEDVAKVAFHSLCTKPGFGDEFFIHRPNFVSAINRQDATLVVHQDQASHPSTIQRVSTNDLNSLNPRNIIQKQPVMNTLPEYAEDLVQIEAHALSCNFVALLSDYYDLNPSIGKPHYNYRPILNDCDVLEFRAQLILGSRSMVSDRWSTQEIAASHVASDMFIEVHPDGFNIIDRMLHPPATPSATPYATTLITPIDTTGNINDIDTIDNTDIIGNIDTIGGIDTIYTNAIDTQKNRVQGKHKRSFPDDDDDQVYVSDTDLNIPSYESKVREILQSTGFPDPVFEYIDGIKGVLCSAKVFVGKKGCESMLSLREHCSRRSAREDVCHDLYVLLQSSSSDW